MHDTHVEIPEYQKEFIDEHNLVLAEVVREGIDGRMMEEGIDVDRWEKVYGR